VSLNSSFIEALNRDRDCPGIVGLPALGTRRIKSTINQDMKALTIEVVDRRYDFVMELLARSTLPRSRCGAGCRLNSRP
jgi:hypothetical protein